MLFHLNSAVMMPARPSGQSSADGTADDATDPGDAQTQELQDRYTGIKALALVFRQIEVEPTHRMVVAGHTDTSGEDSMNFELSRLRADGVRCLLTGDREEWARLSYGRHRVEDYQQIMLYFATERRWNTNPGPIDNVWGSKTKAATKEFFSQVGIAPAMAVAVGNNPSKSWPIQAWQAVYDLYIEDLAGALGEDTDQFKARQSSIGSKFIDPRKMIVACGESFPVDDTDKDNYRSQLNRRVEVLFFDKDDAPSLTCPHQTRTKHTKEECPIWCDHHITRNYIEPADFYAVDYHLQFKYFDRVKKQFQNVPGPIDIKAFKRNEAAGSAPEQIGCVSHYQNGVHTARVRFGEENPDFTGKLLYFEFSAPERAGTPVVRMIHTSGPDATPHVVDRPSDFSTKSFAEKYQYYDLPMKWSSHNYFTRHESTPANDERFHVHVKDKRQLKPYGANVTAQDQPLMFSLDDIVLFDAANTHDQNIQDANQAGTAKALCAGGANPGSRVKVFVVDSDSHCLKLWQKPNDDHTSAPPPPSGAPAPSSPGSNITTARQERIRFERNLVSGLAPGGVIVHFRDDFYAISDQRTTNQPADWMDLAHKPVLGARKAIRDDTNRHLKWERNVSGDPLGYTGDYELHYFHQLYLEDAHPVSFMIVYISMNFMLSAKGAQARTAWAAVPDNADMDDVSNFVNIGVYSANDRLNQKKFYYDETTSSDSSLLIKPCYLIDERETFEIPLASAPSGIDYKKSAQVGNLLTHASVNAAKAAAFGGPVKWITCITPEADGSWAWSIRSASATRPHSVMSLRKSTYQHPTGNWSYQTGGYTEDGESYDCFVFAHELGHATSLQDEYIKTESINIGGNSRSHYAFSHHLIQYTMNPNNDAVLMYHNGAPRLRHCWYHLHFLNTTIQAIPAANAHILKNKTFALRFQRGSKDHTFSRNINWTPSGAAPTAGSASIKSDIREAVIKEGQARVPNMVGVSAAPDLTTLSAALQAKVSFDATGNILAWTDNAVMSNADRDSLRGLFTADANKNKVNDLQQKTRSLRRLLLALYDVGQDESSEGESSSKGCFTGNQNGYRYHGVLVVRVMIGVDVGAPAMTGANVHAKLGHIRAAWVSLNQKYRLSGGPAEIEKVYIHFLPGFKSQASAGTDWNYAMQFVTGYSEILTGTLDTSTLSAGLQTKVTYTAGSHALAYSGVMTTAHRVELNGAVDAGDRAKVEALYQKTNLASADGRVDVAQTLTGTQLRKHFLNMQSGETELAALKFLETWMNDKLSASYTLEQIPAGGP